MKKFLLIMLVAINCYSIPVEITSNPADLQKEMVTRIDSLTTIQGMISAINTAQSVQQQLQALKNLNNFQQNPGNAVIQVNNSVTGLLNSFNLSAGTSFNNLQQLINSLSSSTTSAAMSIKLMQASNMQLMAISNTLQQIQAQQQAIIAYKQAEIARDQYYKEQSTKNNQATVSVMRSY